MNSLFSIVFLRISLLFDQIVVLHAKYDVAFLALFIDDVYCNIVSGNTDNYKSPTRLGLAALAWRNLKFNRCDKSGFGIVIVHQIQEHHIQQSKNRRQESRNNNNAQKVCNGHIQVKNVL